MRGVLAAALWAGAAACYAPAATLRTSATARASLAQELDALLGRLDPGVHVGVQVVSGHGGQVLYERNARQRFVPASVLKLVTGAAALHYLGPYHRFVTDLLVDEPDRKGAVRNVYLRGSGDPSLTDADLLALAASLKQQGVTAILGDIVLDDTVFDATTWGKGWMWDDMPEGFSAPVDGINVMHNELIVSLVPGPRVDTPARVRFAPNSGFATLASTVTTSAPGAPTNVRVQGITPENMGILPGQTVLLSGSLPLDGGPVIRRYAVRDGATYAGTLLREHLRDMRLDVTGVVRRGVVPPSAMLTASHASRELSQSLIEFVKASNNHGMECLIKYMGAVTSLMPGTWNSGIAAVRSFLMQQVGLDASTLSVSDGSGDSRYSLISPQHLVTLLRHMQTNFETGPEFIASLPIGGFDGTLIRRMMPATLHGRVRAKTGTMTGVSSLAGYLQTEEPDVLVFAIMSEGFVGSAEPLRRLQEDVLLALARRR